MSIASEFELRPLGDLVHFINGDRSTNYPKGNDYVEPGIPFISATDLSNGRIDKYSAKGITQAAYDKLRSGKIQPDDILFCLRGSIGKIAYVREGDFGAIASSLVIVRGTEKVNTRYLFFVLSSPSGQQAALGLNNGAAQPNVSVGELQKVRIPLPPMPTQRRIASILFAYDDLIENNTRRIAILEEMARRIYEEWFVHLRFPGHEHVKMVESELGLIPEGWQVTSLQDYCSIVSRGVTPKYQPGSGRFVINQKANRGPELLISELKELIPDLAVPVEKYARFGDVLVNSLGEGTIGRVHYFSGPDNQWAVDQHMTICRCRDVGAGFALYHYLSSEAGQSKIASVKTGATSMTMLNISSLRDFQVLRPPLQIIQKFWDHCSPNVKLKAVLQQKNATLRATRDLLLPKLISGELDVSAMPEPEEAITA